VRLHRAQIADRSAPGRRARTTLLAASVLALGAAVLAGGLLYALGLYGRAGAIAFAAGAGQPPTAGEAFTPELGLPAADVVAIGASQQEAPGEEWAYGALGDAPVSISGREYSDQYTLLQHTPANGWQVLPLPAGQDGKPLAPLGGGSTFGAYGAFAGEATVAGSVVLLSGQNVVVRDPHGQPRLVPAPEAIGSGSGTGKSEVLAAGESLLPGSSASGGVTIPYAAVEDPSGHTGVLIAPSGDGGRRNSAGESEVQPGVLDYDGETEAWTREPIELAREQKAGFVALALACGGSGSAPEASSPRNCWLLGGYRAGGGGGAANRLALFRRAGSSGDPAGFVWEPVQVAGGLLGEQSQTPVQSLGQGAQMLTATAQGAWVDFQAAVNPPPPGGGLRFSDVSELAIPTSVTQASVLGPWCYPTGAMCAQRTLDGPLPRRYRSFASPGAGSGDPGTRVITGLPDRAMLELAHGGADFSYVVGAGGEAGEAPGGAAFYKLGEGSWEGLIADGADPSRAADGEGQSQAIVVAPTRARDDLGTESVPFRRPLLAVAQAPGTTPGDPNASALAVGLEGQIARYTPGEGWRPEALYNSTGQTLRPTLRGVAWPEPNRAYAVGDNGAMWLWREETGLWEPDPAAPFNFIGNLTAIAFAPGEPDLGYAVGKQGVLLKYDKSWEQVPLPAELQQANFTSIAFAGSEAIAGYRLLQRIPGTQDEFMETGGIAVEEEAGTPEAGRHWHVDPQASALLARLPVRATVLSRVAGLLDGGAVAAGPSAVIERESPSSPWRFSTRPLPETQSISALAAYREPSSGAVRAIASIDLNSWLGPIYYSGLNLETGPFKVDLPSPSAPGQPPAFLGPDPLPSSGYVLKETANGWQDMEHMALPAPEVRPPLDMPIRPDPALALVVSSDGMEGLAVGGQTGNLEGRGVNPELFPGNAESQTAAAMRFPAGAASSDGSASTAQVTVPAGRASFVVAGDASCADESCANFAEEGLGPDTWLEHALQETNSITVTAPAGAVRGFLYTGSRRAAPEECGGEGRGEQSREECEGAFSRELERYTALLGGGGSLSVHAADSQDLGPSGAFGCPQGGPPYCSFPSEGLSGGRVVVIVLDFSNGTLGAEQQAWLEQQLRSAGSPTIVLGNEALNALAGAPDQAGDGPAVERILVEDEASAYFFDFPTVNVKTAITYNGRSIPAYGTGTLGYVPPSDERFGGDLLGSSGFLLASIDPADHPYRERPRVVGVSAEVVPNIGSLALDATNGVILSRSEVALFEALARRPLAGDAIKLGASGDEVAGPDPYDKIPFDCQGANCAYEVPTQYTFTSSNPDIADFVEHEAASNNPRQVQLGPGRLPIADSHSGLLCAYNEGTTIVSITTGGLTYSEPVTVRGGSVEYPCGTVPLKNPPRAVSPSRVAFSPNLGPSGSPPGSPQIQPISPPAPANPAPLSPANPAPQPPALFLPPPPLVTAVPVIIPPLSPSVARPTPPSGTAQVFEPSGVTQEEDEEESAEETAGASQFSAYHPDEHPWPGPWLAFPLLVIVAGAGLSVGRGSRNRSRRGRRQAARGISVARASVSAKSTRV
jgi:hypothetical protein